MSIESGEERTALEEEARARIDAWRSRGDFIDTPDGRVFVVDTGAPDPETTVDPTDPARSFGGPNNDTYPPLLVLHGFPTCSYDFAGVIDALASNRRVIMFDQIGFGLSDKPDRRYGIHLHADTAEHVLAATGLGRFDLLTHDMGDSVGGELLARDSGSEVRKRVITNGSIYLDLAQLTIGQQLLMGLPDQATDELPVDNFIAGVTGTYAPADQADPGNPSVDPVDSLAHGLLARNNAGLTLMARLIRYLEDRQREESRYTGAIESHAAPLHIVWGDLDPVAVVVMSQRLFERRELERRQSRQNSGDRGTGTNATRGARAGGDDITTVDDLSNDGTNSSDHERHTTIEILDGVGHYPMIEAPARFAAAVLRGLSPHD